MAETLAELQVKLTAIKKARDSGVLMVRHGDTSTQFRTLSEMDQIIRSLSRQIDSLNGTRRSRVNYISQNTKGFGC